MDFDFRAPEMERLWTDAEFTAGFARPVVKAYRKVVEYIRRAKDERDFRELKSLRYKKLQGERSHQHSMRLNKQYRLVLEVETTSGGKKIWIIEIKD